MNTQMRFDWRILAALVAAGLIWGWIIG